MTRIGTDKNPF